jgi:hypothetical protein
VKGMKGHVSKIARDEHGSMVSRKFLCSHGFAEVEVIVCVCVHVCV